MLGRMKQSALKLDTEISSFIELGRNYRKLYSKGTVVVIDKDDDICKFLRFLVSNCDLSLRVIHVSDPDKGKIAIDSIDSRFIKAVIIDCSLVSKASKLLDEWIDSVPVLISNCGQELDSYAEHKQMRFLSRDVGLMDYIEALGLPDECNDWVVAYPTYA